MQLKPTISVLLFADCLALSLKPQGEGQASGEDAMIRFGVDPNSSRLVPLIIIMDDCSGSTFVQEVARGLLGLHGLQVYNHEYELLKPNKNEAHQAEPQFGMGHAMDRMATLADKQNKVLVFKAEPQLLDEEIASAMKAHRARVVHVFRRNVLDQAVCRIRDCFMLDDRFGYPVDAEGQRSHLCFARRYHDKIIKAHLNEDILKWMQNRVQIESGVSNLIVGWGFPTALTVEENDLSAFQYGAIKYNTCDVACSVRAWCRLLSSWGIDAKPDSVSNYLSSIMSSAGDSNHKPPGPHRDTIANYEEIKARLAGTPLAEFWRD